ncbi:hypothetical protein ABT389_36930 [Streptomyces bacillaris]|uniref:hypothetical protein n=1 Tax=Streptomyces bacillaris TaxID=68179 RepID=UPI003347008B
MVLIVGVVVIAAAALAAGYLLGRLRPCSGWAVDEFRFTGLWVLGGQGRQAVVIPATS